MAIKNLYQEAEKEKKPYSTYRTAAPRTQSAAQSSSGSMAQSAPQSSVWNAEQSTPRSQTGTAPKPKREKTPSELGEEVIKTMLEDVAAEERKKQAAADRAAQYGGNTTGTKATAGKQKAAQYGGTAGL